MCEWPALCAPFAYCVPDFLAQKSPTPKGEETSTLARVRRQLFGPSLAEGYGFVVPSVSNFSHVLKLSRTLAEYDCEGVCICETGGVGSAGVTEGGICGT
jgi:hypothetical protein